MIKVTIAFLHILWQWLKLISFCGFIFSLRRQVQRPKTFESCYIPPEARNMNWTTLWPTQVLMERPPPKPSARGSDVDNLVSFLCLHWRLWSDMKNRRTFLSGKVLDGGPCTPFDPAPLGLKVQEGHREEAVSITSVYWAGLKVL